MLPCYFRAFLRFFCHRDYAIMAKHMQLLLRNRGTVFQDRLAETRAILM